MSLFLRVCRPDSTATALRRHACCVTKDTNLERHPGWFTPTVIIVGAARREEEDKDEGKAKWKIAVDRKTLSSRIIAAELHIHTNHTHGVLHSPQKGAEGIVYLNDKPVENFSFR